MTPHRPRRDSESGQALVLMLGVVAALITGSLVLAGFGQALGGKSRAQRGADLAAMSAATQMRDDYPRLFEAAVLEDGSSNPRHLSSAEYAERARAAAMQIGRRNGARIKASDVSFSAGFAPTRVTVRVRGTVAVNVGAGAEAPDRQAVAVSASAAAELSPTLGTGPGMPATASGGGYDGPLAYRMGKPMRPDVAQAFDAMARAAARDGLALSVTSEGSDESELTRR